MKSTIFTYHVTGQDTTQESANKVTAQLMLTIFEPRVLRNIKTVKEKDDYLSSFDVTFNEDEDIKECLVAMNNFLYHLKLTNFQIYQNQTMPD